MPRSILCCLVLICPFLVSCGSDGGSRSDAGHAPIDARIDATPRLDAKPALAFALWAHSRDTLFSISPDTFALTIIGSFDVDDDITDLAVTPDETLYGISLTKLYRLDPRSGKATYIADVTGKSNVGMTFLPDGTLLAADSDGGVRQIEPSTGSVNEVGVFGQYFTTAGDLVAVADGTMYAISGTGDGCSFDSNCLITVNPGTGAATGKIGAIGYGQVFGAAYANGHVYAFTNGGQIIEIDRTTGQGTLVKKHPVSFWGAGVTPLVPVIE